MIATFVPRTPGINRMPPAYLIGAGLATGAALSALYHWNNVSNDFGMVRPVPFSYPVPSFPYSVPFVGHKNKYINTNPHLVYEFYFTPKPDDIRTPILRYGIADMLGSGYDRPERQRAAMQALYVASADWRPRLFAPNRFAAVAAEQSFVTVHYGLYRESPRAQILPLP